MSIHSLLVEAPMRTPPHPGRIIRQDCIEPLDLSHRHDGGSPLCQGSCRAL